MRPNQRCSWLAWPIAMLMVFVTLPLAAQVVAQGSTSHPAHIHEGTCDNLGDVIEPLDNVGTAEAASVSGATTAIPVQVSETDVDLALDDILAGEHAINIHESDDNIQTYIACGDIGGAVRGGTLLIGLAQLNTSSFSGVAVLEENEAGGTTVSVFLTEGAAGAPAADAAAADDATTDDAAADDTAAATTEPTAVAVADEAATDAAADDAAADDAAADEATVAAPTVVPAVTEEPAAEDAAPAGETIEVDIVDFAFNPNPIEINVGDTIVWTNQDGVPHTVTGQDRALLQSGTMQAGATFSQTFTAPGEIAYFCEFHPNMNGTIIVN